jgi:polyisoprenoid-binding protein YceI
MMSLIVLFLFLRSLSPASSRQLEYIIDPAQSTFRVRTGSSGLFKAFGHDHTIAIREFSGRLQLTPESITPASLDLDVDANSLSVVGDAKDAARIEQDMRQTVLESATYPQIKFHSTNIVLTSRSADQLTATITGELTLHGVTRTVQLPAEATVTAERVRARGRFSLRQTDYKIKPFSVAGGTVRVKDQIELTFDIIALERNGHF